MLINVILERTKVTPAVTMLIDDGIIEIDGESFPENPVEFFNPIYEWIDTFMNEEKRYLTVNFKMTYFNTSSSKCLMDIVDRCQSYHNRSGGNVEINWYYHEDDSDMQESGAELAEDADLNFKLIAYRQKNEE